MFLCVLWLPCSTCFCSALASVAWKVTLTGRGRHTHTHTHTRHKLNGAFLLTRPYRLLLLFFFFFFFSLVTKRVSAPCQGALPLGIFRHTSVHVVSNMSGHGRAALRQGLFLKGIRRIVGLWENL